MLGLLCFLPVELVAQRGKPLKAADLPVFFEADNQIYDQFEQPDATRLSGHVIFRHAGMTLRCDSAVYFQGAKSFEAFGKVHFTQGDTLSIKGDHFLYDGMAQTAYVRHHNKVVEVRHHKRFLYSDSIFYNIGERLLIYSTGGKLIDADNVLTSEYGEYYTNSRQAVFKYNVKLLNPKSELVTNELHYNTQTRVATVVGESNVVSGDYNIHTTSGKYQTNSDVVELFERSILHNKVRRLHMEADQVYYDKKNGNMKARGRVICIDERTKAVLTGNECEYYENKEAQSDSSFVTGHALVKDYSNGKDTLYVHADTLRMYSYHVQTDTLRRVLKGYYHARCFRTDVQAVSDSLVYDTRLRLLSLYRDPIVWSDSRQILGEEILVFANDSTVDSVYVNEQALLVERLDSVHYNQVTGKQMRAYFDRRTGELRTAETDGNVCMVLFVTEKDSTILYHNYTESAKLRMVLDRRKLQHAVAYPNPVGKLYPLGMAPRERTFLPNFAWFDYIRPLSKDDLFEWRPKKSGTELRTTPRRVAPLQHISR